MIAGIRPSEDGALCGTQIGHEPCWKPAVGRASYGLWQPPEVIVPEGVPHPSTLFVGACEDHIEMLAWMARQRGGDIER